ncbi:hypothetical protein QQ045_004844 [Rhodiola kirilowii]
MNLPDHQLNVQPAGQSSMDDGDSSSNPVPISQGMEVLVSDEELETLLPEASFIAIDDPHVAQHVIEHCIPSCPEDQKPRIGMSFPSTELAVDFYRKFALFGSFDVRCGTTRKYKDGIVKKKHFYCNRQGFPQNDSYDTSNGKRIRNCPSLRCGCQASMVIGRRGSLGYKMIFVPFTGIDNHKNSITFAAALLSREDVESYTWLLNSFLKCMGPVPNIVLTDQEPSLRVVVPKVIPDTHHRFCIWHIMRKLSVKVGYRTPRLQKFRSKMKSLVYDYHTETKDFKAKWIRLMAEYEMSGHKWLSKMFRLREFWIPAYFRDIPLGRLLRTTSRSESQNSFFGSFLNMGIGKIPGKYVLNRWTKTAIETAAQGVETCLVEDCQTIQQADVAEQELWTEFNACLIIAANDIEKTDNIHHKLKEMRVYLEEVSNG